MRAYRPYRQGGLDWLTVGFTRFSIRRSDLLCHRLSQSLRNRWQVTSLNSLDKTAYCFNDSSGDLVDGLVNHYRPSNPRHFIGQGNNGFVEPARCLDLVDPAAQRVVFLCRPDHDRTGAVH